MNELIFILLIVLYWAFTSWVIFATFVNFILKPYLLMSKNRAYTASDSVIWTYVVLWTGVLASPHVYPLILRMMS